MVLKEKLLYLWHKVHSIIENKRAEASFQWIDDVLYYISGKTRIRIEEHFAENGKDITSLLENVIIYDNTHGKSVTNNREEKAS